VVLMRANPGDDNAIEKERNRANERPAAEYEACDRAALWEIEERNHWMRDGNSE
jgi:hypothetical protein